VLSRPMEGETLYLYLAVFAEAISVVLVRKWGLIVECTDGIMLEVSLKFPFSATNNQAEYEACIAGLNQALEMRAKNLKLHIDSQLLVT
jgi:ribonuclease HI